MYFIFIIKKGEPNMETFKVYNFVPQQNTLTSSIKSSWKIEYKRGLFFKMSRISNDKRTRINFYMNKKNTWNLSFYTARENVDVSKIAAGFGGGGHQKAAGASKLETLPEFLLKGLK